jgi:methyl-accepting chemotaxis protein
LIIRKLKPLDVVEHAVNEIASGSADLTRQINVKTNDGIGIVVYGFNRFTAKLQSIMKELKTLKDDLSAEGDELCAGTDDTAAAVAQISAKIEEAKLSIGNQSAGVEETAGAVNEIVSNIMGSSVGSAGGPQKFDNSGNRRKIRKTIESPV